MPMHEISLSIHEVASLRHLKDVRAKVLYSIDFFKLLLWTDSDLLVSEMKQKLGVTGFVSEIRRVEN